MNTKDNTVYENENVNDSTNYETPENTVFENEENSIAENESTENLSSEQPKTKKWIRTAGAFGGGILMGSLATILTASSKAPENIENNNGEEIPVEVEVPGTIGEIQVAQGVTDDMSFGDAFAAARSEVGSGGAFIWRGNVYNTYTADEWNSMTDEQREAYINNFQSQSDHIIAHNMPSGQNNEGINIVDTTPEQTNTNEVAQDVEIEVVGIAQDPETGAVYAGLKINEQEVLMVDGNNDNIIDVAVVDANHDGTISENEIVDMSGENLYMSDIATLQTNQSLAMGPDYTNDADTSNYNA